MTAYSPRRQARAAAEAAALADAGDPILAGAGDPILVPTPAATGPNGPVPATAGRHRTPQRAGHIPTPAAASDPEPGPPPVLTSSAPVAATVPLRPLPPAPAPAPIDSGPVGAWPEEPICPPSARTASAVGACAPNVALMPAVVPDAPAMNAGGARTVPAVPAMVVSPSNLGVPAPHPGIPAPHPGIPGPPGIPAPTSTGRRGRGRRGPGPDDQTRLAAPVVALCSALERHDRDVVAATMSPQVRLEVPSLGIRCTGRDEVLDAIGTMLVAFPDFRYRVHGRYVAPGQVTDEAVLEGTWTGPLLGSPPRGTSGQVPARVLVTHDGRVVTAASVWVDPGALRDLIDLPDAVPGHANPLVSRLRATLPTPEGRLIVAQERDVPTAEPEPPTPPSPIVRAPQPPPPVHRRDLKVPVPRTVRRLQGAGLALVMSAASAGLFWWVASGTVRTTEARPGPPVTVTLSRSPVSVAATPSQQVAGAAESVTGLVQLKFDETRNEFELSSDALFFDTDSAELTPRAQTVLAKVIGRIREERRYGRITVSGYTDQRGSSSHNKRLSQDRADAVAAALRRSLGNLTGRVSVVAVGHGEQHPLVTKGTTATQLAPNRRVVIQVPRPRT